MIYGLACLDNFNRGKLIGGGALRAQGESRAAPSRGVSLRSRGDVAVR